MSVPVSTTLYNSKLNAHLRVQLVYPIDCCWAPTTCRTEERLKFAALKVYSQMRKKICLTSLYKFLLPISLTQNFALFCIVDKCYFSYYYWHIFRSSYQRNYDFFLSLPPHSSTSSYQSAIAVDRRVLHSHSNCWCIAAPELLLCSASGF